MQIFIQIVIAVIVSAISYALSPKPKQQKPNEGRLDIPSPKLGEPIQVIFGEVWIDDPAISYYGNVSTTPIKVKGGK